MLSIGIVGLPNVGKSTLFSALTAAHADVSNYPFTTIESATGVVAVPDERLQRLADVIEPDEVIPATISFIDIAGLVEGASHGEGLGNQFLDEIRRVDALAHVLRAFGGTDVAHVFADVDPVRDADVVETELLLADLDIVQRMIERRSATWHSDPKEHAAEQRRVEGWREQLQEGTPLRAAEPDPAERAELGALGLLTGKPLLYVLNVAEGREPPEDVVTALGNRPHVGTVAIAAEIERELSELEPEEREEFVRELGLEEHGLERFVRAVYDLLGLRTFYTAAHGKLQAWELPRETTAVEAAARIHSDIADGFIKAQVASAADLLEHGSLTALREHGLIRTAGRDHPIEDGDVVEFMFKAS